jgi:hypothetical protein
VTDQHDHAPVADQCVVVNRNLGGGQCAICGISLNLKNGGWIPVTKQVMIPRGWNPDLVRRLREVAP